MRQVVSSQPRRLVARPARAVAPLSVGLGSLRFRVLGSLRFRKHAAELPRDPAPRGRPLLIAIINNGPVLALARRSSRAWQYDRARYFGPQPRHSKGCWRKHMFPAHVVKSFYVPDTTRVKTSPFGRARASSARAGRPSRLTASVGVSRNRNLRRPLPDGMGFLRSDIDLIFRRTGILRKTMERHC